MAHPRRRRKSRSGYVRGSAGPPKILALLAACPLFPEPVAGQCGACAKPLRGRRTRWCSRTCAWAWRTNHEWPRARRAARTRDKRTCRSCGVQRPPKPNRKRFASDTAFERAQGAYDAVRLEVNHRVPLAGARRADPGCVHHLENLETLCGDCHRLVTTAQAAARAAARREARRQAIETTNTNQERIIAPRAA